MTSNELYELIEQVSDDLVAIRIVAEDMCELAEDAPDAHNRTTAELRLKGLALGVQTLLASQSKSATNLAILVDVARKVR